MEASPSATELLDSATLCMHMLVLVLACAGGIYGALKARKAGAPGLGPMATAGGFGILLAMGLWTILVGVAPSSVWEWSDFRRILNVLGILLDLGGTAALVVGFALLTPAKSEGAS
ncbi:MAG: hypothetical protein KC619_17445 [Myxococcales bacterium]|nr:hypothetical protein [Myxococcales bacterium]